MTPTQAFWRYKTLAELNSAEWEALCDGCGKCCLHKLQDADTGEVYYTEVACRLLDAGTCRCRDYAHRTRRVSDCIALGPDLAAALSWLPSTCAYRLLAEGKDLPAWHPLVCGDGEAVHAAGVSVRGRVVAEESAGELEDHIVTWPE